MRLVAVLERRLRSDLDACSADQLSGLAGEARAGLAWLEGYLTRVAAAAQRREAAGDGVAADDVIRGDGELSRARADAVTARAAVADTLPALGGAIADGTARPENADAAASLVAKLSPAERARLGPHDGDLARRAASEAPEAFERHLKARAREVRDRPSDQDLSRAEREKARSHLSLGRKLNGRWWLHGDLADEWGAPVHDRIRAHARLLAGEGPVTPNHMAQALYELITGVPHTDSGPSSSRYQMGIGYIVDAATLFTDHHSGPAGPASSGGGSGVGGTETSSGSGGGGSAAGSTEQPDGLCGVVSETWAGHPVDPELIRRLACDTDLYAILIGTGGDPRGLHQTHRSANRQQRLQLRALYPTCPLDGTTPFDRCEIHHVNLAHGMGGPTVLANLVPISSRWHHRIHDLGWQLTMRPDRTLELRTPDGTLHRIIPPPTPITRQRE